MRFTTSCAVLTCLCLGASAEILPSDPTMILGGSAVTILPSELTASGEGCFMIGEADGKVSVHDASFEKLRTLDTPSLPDVVMTMERRIQIRVYDRHYYGDWINGDYASFPTIGDVRDYLRDMGVVWKAEVLDQNSPTGDILFVESSLSDWAKPFFDVAAERYPEFPTPVVPADEDIPYKVYRYSDPAGAKRLRLEWWPNVKDFPITVNGAWGAFPVTKKVAPVNTQYQTEQHAHGADGGTGLVNNVLTWSQTLFNDDDNFECLVPDYEIVPMRETLNDFISDNFGLQLRGDTLRVSGYSVVNDRGERLSSVDIPVGYEVIGTPRIMSLKNQAYLAVSALARTGGSARDEYLLMYAIDRATGSLRSVAAPVRVAVSPTACDSGTPVNVTLGSASARPVRIAATSLGGAAVATGSIPPGATASTLDTTGLPSGMYIVTVSDSSTVNESSKILVR